MAPYSSTSNGMAGQVLQTIQEAGLSALHTSFLPLGFWPEAFDSVIYAMNQSLHSATKAIPFEVWNRHRLSLSNLRVFSSVTDCVNST